MESTLCVDDELREDEYDAFNDETFGGAEADDAWEENHNVLAAQLEETIKRQHIVDIVNTSLRQLGLDDEASSSAAAAVGTTTNNGHQLSTAQTSSSRGDLANASSALAGVGSVNSGNQLGPQRSSQRSPPTTTTTASSSSSAVCPPGFNGFFRPVVVASGGAGLSTAAAAAAAAGPLPTAPGHGAHMGGPPIPIGSQLGHQPPPGGGPMQRPPATVSPFRPAAPFPSMLGCPAVSAEQLEQQMLQASRAPQAQPKRVKTLGELEKEMVQESRRAILARRQQYLQQQQQQQQQQPQLPTQPPIPEQRPPSTPQYRILRPPQHQQQQQQQQQPPFSSGSLPLIPPSAQSRSHGPSGGSIGLGHAQRPPYTNQINQISDMDYTKKGQQQQHHPLLQQQQQQPTAPQHLEQPRNYRGHDQYGYPDSSGPRPQQWEVNHNLHHHNKWPAQPGCYPAAGHFQRPSFHQPAAPAARSFMNSWDAPHRSNTRRYEEIRSADWNSSAGQQQRRYNTRDVETFGFDAVHEYQQEQDANKATRTARSDDPYAGLMTDKEKEFVIRVQMMSLNMQAPHEQDYYYLEYMKRRSQGKAVCRNRLLTQRYERGSDRPHEPQQFENSLGKLHSVTAHAPKKILDMAGSRKLDDGDGRTVPANRDLLLFRKLLMDTEQAFSLLLKLEDPEVLTPRDEKLIAAKELVERLGPSPDNVLSLRKGRMLVLRSLAALWRLDEVYREPCLKILCSIIENLELILLKQKPLGDSVFVDKFDIIDDILNDCSSDEIDRLRNCLTKYTTPGDEIGRWILRGKFGKLLSARLAGWIIGEAPI